MRRYKGKTFGVCSNCGYEGEEGQIRCSRCNSKMDSIVKVELCVKDYFQLNLTDEEVKNMEENLLIEYYSYCLENQYAYEIPTNKIMENAKSISELRYDIFKKINGVTDISILNEIKSKLI